MKHLHDFRKSGLEIDVLKALYYLDWSDYKNWQFKVNTTERRIYGRDKGRSWLDLTYHDYENEARNFDYYWTHPERVKEMLDSIDMSRVIIE